MSQTFTLYIKSDKNIEEYMHYLKNLFDVKISKIERSTPNRKLDLYGFRLPSPNSLDAEIEHFNDTIHEHLHIYKMIIFSAYLSEEVSIVEAQKIIGQYVFDTLKETDLVGLLFIDGSSSQVLANYEYFSKEDQTPQSVSLFVTSDKTPLEFIKSLQSIYHSSSIIRLESNPEQRDVLAKLFSRMLALDVVITQDQNVSLSFNRYEFSFKSTQSALAEGPFEAQVRNGKNMFMLLRDSNLFGLALVHIDKNEVLDEYDLHSPTNDKDVL